MSYCDCEREGRDAFRRDRHSYETRHRLDAGRHFGNECDRKFAEGFEREQRRYDEERRDEQERQENAARREQERQRRDAEDYAEYELWQQHEQDERAAQEEYENFGQMDLPP